MLCGNGSSRDSVSIIRDARMAKARAAGVNKSQEIRSYLADHPDASAKDVVAALAGKGITINEGLVNNVKSSSRKRDGAGGRRRVKVRRGRGRRGANKSEAIRGYLEQHPNATPKEITAALKAQGIEASPGLISVIKYGGKGKGAGNGRRKKVAHRGGAAGGGRPVTTRLSAEDLFAVKNLAEQLGGIQEVRSALDALERLGLRG